jgi:DNA-binding IclR family transcriptional regulator
MTTDLLQTREAPVGNSTVARAFELLTLFTVDEPTLTADDVARRVGMTRSTAYRYLKTLSSLGLLAPAHPDRFRLGPQTLRLGLIAQRSLNIVEAARPIMSQLGAQVDEVVLLNKRFDSEVICLERRQSSKPVQVSFEPGRSLPVNASAGGRVLLAWAPEAEVTAVLSKVSWREVTSTTIRDELTFRRELERVRAKGYAVSHGELDANVLGVAAPVRDASGEVVASLSVAALDQGLGPDDIDRLAAAVVAAAAELSRAIGRQGSA